MHYASSHGTLRGSVPRSASLPSHPCSSRLGMLFSTRAVEVNKQLTTPARIHLCTAEVLTTLGPSHAPLSPNAHLRLFIWSDIIVLFIQGLGLGITFSGGARAAGPWGLLLQGPGHTGQTILFAGLLLHTLTLATALSLLLATYVKAGRADRRSYGAYHSTQTSPGHAPPPAPFSARFKAFLVVLPLAGACVLVRCAYRTAAAWDGLGGSIARDDMTWLVAEGLLLTEAMVTLAVFHPAFFLEGGGDNVAAAADDVEAGGRKRRPASSFMNGKRVSSGTTLSMADLDEAADEEKQRHGGRDPRHEASHLIFSPNMVMAPSDHSESSESGGSRRGSGAGVLQADPYYRYETSPYDSDRRFLSDEEVDITAETRGLSPMEAEAEEARRRADAESFVVAPPRKSSKRVSRILEEQDVVDDPFEVESFVEPPRKSSKRMSRTAARQESDGEDEEGARFAGSSFEPPRKSSKRTSRLLVPTAADNDDDEDDDGVEVASFVLPPRKPSRRETLRKKEREGTLDSVSLYSQ